MIYFFLFWAEKALKASKHEENKNTYTESEVRFVAVVNLHGEVLGFGGGQFTLLIQEVKDSIGLHLNQFCVKQHQQICTTV